jgi:hypothetical protein
VGGPVIVTRGRHKGLDILRKTLEYLKKPGRQNPTQARFFPVELEFASDSMGLRFSEMSGFVFLPVFPFSGGVDC